ncbi:glycerol kinase [Paraglaciecola sp.]|uniref:glycerol kinase n=1 Tax=Paraglaciecola sp. TaxID=1920173 RepID=UPI003EF5CEFA
MNFIVRDADKWTLTAKGKLAGGRIKTSVKLGDYIEWPEDFNLDKLPEHQTPDTPIEMVTSTQLSKDFGISAVKLNHVFSELGWVNKSLKGWVVTEQGLKQGAEQSEDTRSGAPYVKWPMTITQSKILLSSTKALTGALNTTEINGKTKHIAIDGHCLASNAEMIIDNWLYMAEIVHAYHRKLPIEEDIYSDFYIPAGKVYVEYWGYNNDPMYLARKEKKLAIYQKYDFHLIELTDKDVQNLDETLPKRLLKFGIQAY